LASGGYIINIKPTAIGMDVDPIESDWVKSEIPGHKWPLPTPMAIAKNIQTVRNRSSRDSRPMPVISGTGNAAASRLCIVRPS